MPDERGVGGGVRPLVELTRVRVLEFVREPEALFWVFIFPVLLALALGIAFRNKAPDKLHVAVTGVGAARVEQALAGSRDVATERFVDAAAANEALRRGRVDLVVIADAAGEPTLRYDAIRAEGRAARLAVSEALGGGRPAVREEVVNEPGGRYIDFLIPGLIGLNLMGSGMCSSASPRPRCAAATTCCRSPSRAWSSCSSSSRRWWRSAGSCSACACTARSSRSRSSRSPVRRASPGSASWSPHARGASRRCRAG
jgi:hypothetical protein